LITLEEASSIVLTEMKFMGHTAKYSWFDHSINGIILEVDTVENKLAQLAQKYLDYVSEMEYTR
jgi:uncharacterized Rossmann fold enzyme